MSNHKKHKILNVKEMDFPLLVDLIKSKKKDDQIYKELAYNEIEQRMKLKIESIINRFYIPGLERSDIYQEALFALRFKAVPDFKKNTMGKNGVYPFDKFAIMCISRYLISVRKRSYQNRSAALNTSISLDQDRNSDVGESLFLNDILPVCNGTILDKVAKKEFLKLLFNSLFEKLSKFEKKVFILYSKKYSYEEMKKIVNKIGKKRDIKSIDNALSRIKQKANIVYNENKDDFKG
ncbi:MAG: hypothetical protein WC942_07765 [Clostridia bacterium]|jgi:hypothetical protein